MTSRKNLKGKSLRNSGTNKDRSADGSVSAFSQRVYALVKKVPKGKVTSYGVVAKALNSSPRAVGQALKRNPYAPIVPCHRVIRQDMTLGGFNGVSQSCGGMFPQSHATLGRKVRLLKEEGVCFNEHGDLQDPKTCFLHSL
jgi:methylated-DNA-[protein]-cysteine S-methyltransferase